MWWFQIYQPKVSARCNVLSVWLLGRLKMLTRQKSAESWDRGQASGFQIEGECGSFPQQAGRQALRSWLSGGGAALTMKYRTVVMYMEIGCFVSCLCGWILVCSTLPTEYWTFSEVGSIVLTTSNYYSNLWRDCISDTTGVSDCKDYPSMLALPGRRQANIIKSSNFGLLRSTIHQSFVHRSMGFAFSQYFYTPAERSPSAPSSPVSLAASSHS